MTLAFSPAERPRDVVGRTLETFLRHVTGTKRFYRQEVTPHYVEGLRKSCRESRAFYLAKRRAWFSVRVSNLLDREDAASAAWEARRQWHWDVARLAKTLALCDV